VWSDIEHHTKSYKWPLILQAWLLFAGSIWTAEPRVEDPSSRELFSAALAHGHLHRESGLKKHKGKAFLAEQKG